MSDLREALGPLSGGSSTPEARPNSRVRSFGRAHVDGGPRDSDSGGDYLDDEERQRLHAALERSVEQAREGKLIDAGVVMARPRALP